MSKKKILIALNSLLIIIILLFSFFKFFRFNVAFECEYGKHPGKILAIAAENFPGFGDSDLKVLCVFNNLPGMDILENIEKLYRLYRSKVAFGAIFAKDFKPAYELDFPYRMLSRYKFSCTKEEGATDRGHFLLIQGDKIIHNTDAFDFFALNFVLQKKIDPNLSIASTQIQTKDLKTHIIQKMTEKELELSELNTGKVILFNDMKRFSKIFFFHANCSGCRLKSLIQDIKLLEILDKENSIIIFSIFANRFELKSLLDEKHTTLPVYIDTKDKFSLSGKITNDKETPIIITGEELRRF
jgi:thiol-disulfide isomerase/thioredoxin